MTGAYSDERDSSIRAGDSYLVIPNVVVDRNHMDEFKVHEHYSPRRGRIKRIVLHHDAALSARSCIHILKRRGLSTHFVIDNDGTVFQLLDPSSASAWAQGRGWNQTSIALDISNACELRFSDHYTRPRPVVTQRIQHTKIKWLAPYPEQVEVLARLVAGLCAYYDIPIEVPRDKNGKVIMHYTRPIPSGIVGHFHISKRKVDPFGLDWEKFLELVRRFM